MGLFAEIAGRKFMADKFAELRAEEQRDISAEIEAKIDEVLRRMFPGQDPAVIRKRHPLAIARAHARLLGRYENALQNKRAFLESL